MQIFTYSNTKVAWVNRRHTKQRVLALLFFLGFAASLLMPPVGIYAAELERQREQVPAPTSAKSKAGPHIKQYDEDKLNKPMKQDYAGAIAATPLGSKVAETKVGLAQVLPIPTKPEEDPKPTTRQEIISERSANTQVFQNPDGTRTLHQTVAPRFYKKEGQWQKIDTTLVEDKNAGDATNPLAKLWGQARSVIDSEQAFIVADNEWRARFSPSDFPGGMFRMQMNGQQYGLVPEGAKRVAPVASKDRNGRQQVHYYDLWPGVDVRYTINGAVVKEDIILKNKDAQTDFSYKVVGASVAKAAEGLRIKGVLNDKFGISPINLIRNDTGHVEDATKYKQEITNGKVHVSVDQTYIRSLDDAAFPTIIDPYHGVGVPTGNYVSYDDVGSSCAYPSCAIRGGSLNTGSWRAWRGVFYIPYNTVVQPGADVFDAEIGLDQITGTSNLVSFQLYQATCTHSYNCASTGIFGASTNDVYDEAILDATPIYQSFMSSSNTTGHVVLRGQECACNSHKEFDIFSATLDIDFNHRPNIPTPEVPSTDPNTEVTVVTTQPTLGITTASDPDGSAIKYQYKLTSTTGVELYSTDLVDSTRITIPEGLLQDGGTYTWHYTVTDGTFTSPWQNGGKIRVDLRTGKDKTSTYETVGPIDVSLNTGNMYTSVDSHAIKALDGNIGLSLNYNSPYASRPGLRASYYANDPTFSNPPILRRTEPTVDNDWKLGSPATNILPINNFSAKYEGYFTAPNTGSYQFGGTNDDNLKIVVDGQTLYNNSGCYGTTRCWGSSISLTAGQTVTFLAEYIEGTDTAYAKAYVKGAVDESLLKTEWLKTAPMPTDSNSGLMGHYYADDGSHNPTSLPKILTRQDPAIDFTWGAAAPIPNVQADNYYVVWEGYYLPPVTGTYKFGVGSDDGARVTVGTGSTPQYSQWTSGNWRTGYDTTGVPLTQNTPVKIKVEFFEATGDARAQLLAKTPLNADGAVVEAQYLTPGGKFLPSGWSLSSDADGNLAYERLEVRQNGDVIMYDADGSTQLFTNTGSGFKPPVNEEAYLIRNADASYSLTDADGRMYVFNGDGTLRETQAPLDDRKPAALKYDYATVNGMPRLTAIKDGVNTARKGELHYAGDDKCDDVSAPSGFQYASGINLCTFITSDGQRTDFFYNTDNQLALVLQPGGARESYGYEATTGMMTNIQDVLANDAIAAGVRTNNATTKTEITYDVLKRVSTVTAPAPTASASRTAYSLDYLPQKSKLHVVGSTEPNGYTQYIEYDELLRTTKDCDVAALCSLSDWHATKDLSLATTDPVGLKSTTLYDADDRPTHQYGPAPTAWFDTTREPLTTYTSQVPHTETAYDESLVGPAVSWHNYKRSGTEPGVLFGAPKLHSTGIEPSTPGVLSSNLSPAPITADSGMQGTGFSATGKVHLPNGTYSLQSTTADGVRVWIDDTLVLDGWADASSRTVSGSTTFTVASNAVKRFRLDVYRRTATTGSFNLQIQQAGGFAWTTNWASWLKPNYGLGTTTKVYDATLGNSTSTTSYGANPELSLPASSSVDPTGLNLTTTNAYEAPGATDSFLRQTHKYLPGANTAVASTATQYAHYAPNDTKDNPCTTGTTEAFKQGGFMKLKTEPDPDGTGTQTGRKTETIYDDAGRVVASRYNTDSWTCTTYDSRGRVTQTVIPAYNGEPARTVTNNYAVSGNPLQTSSADGNGTIIATVDLLGRTVDYADVYGNWTGYEYNQFGQLTRKYGDMGEEIFYYDSLRRLSQHLFDEVVYATIIYDAYSRVDYIDYNNAGQMRLTIGRDTLGRTTSQTYRMGNGTTVISDTVTRTQSGQITGDTISNGTTSLASTYTYDGADRLTGATIGTNTYSYGFGTQNSTTCGTGIGTNANSGKNSNRTTQTINGVTTNFCYDYADRLTNSSNNLYSGTTYDTHGNMTNIGTGTSPLYLAYDSSDRAIGYEEANSSGNGTALYYDRDVANRIIGRYKSTITGWNYVGSGDWFYNFTGTGDAPDFVRNANWDIIEQNISLPGGVLLTLKPQESVTNNKKQYSLPNTHGDTMLTTNAAGTNTSNGNGPSSVFVYDPFGNAITGSVLPSNTNGGSYGWVGQHQKHSETNLALKPIVMGARIYLPTLGRFTQVDPVEGGVENSYIYPTNPVSDFDFSGQASQRGQQSRQPKRLSADEQRALKDGKNKWNRKTFEAAKKKWEYNQKMDQQRNKQKRDNNNRKGPKGGSPGSPPTVTGGNSPTVSPQAAEAAVVAGGTVATVVAVWWALKPLAVACGPAAPVCVIVL